MRVFQGAEGNPSSIPYAHTSKDTLQDSAWSLVDRKYFVMPVDIRHAIKVHQVYLAGMILFGRFPSPHLYTPT